MSDIAYAGVGTARLSSDDDDEYTISGVALGAGDVTVGKSGIKKKWPGDELRKAAETLEGKPLVRDHENNTEGRVGTVTDAWFKDGVGVLYEAEIASHYEQLAQDIKAGIQEVSARAYHKEVDQLEEDEETGAYLTENITFDNLSIVSQGASPSNTVDIGGVDTSNAVAMAQGPSGSAVATLESSVERDDETESGSTDESTADDSEDTEEELGHKYEIGDLIEWGEDDYGSIVGVSVDDGVHRYDVRVFEAGENGYRATDETETVLAHNAHRCFGKPDLTSSDSDEYSESGSDDDENVAELESAWHTPDWDGLDDLREWSKPSLEDFDTDDLSDIDDHFFVSKTGEWPPENYGDLALPAVWPDGELSLDGLDSVHQMAGQTDGVSDDMADSIQSKANELAMEHFDSPVEGEEMSNSDSGESEELDDAEQGDDRSVNVAMIQDDDPNQASTGGIAALQPETITNTTMTNIDYESATDDEIEDLDDPVVIERDDVEDLQSKAERAEELDDRLDEVNSTLDELAENQETLEDVDEEKIEELSEYDDARVLTGEEYEELQGLVDDIGSIFADELADYSPFDSEELQERFTPLELREKVDEHDEASIAEEMEESGDPDPDGGSADSEELEESSGDDEDPSAEEVREAVARNLEEDGLTRQADKVREGKISLEEMGIEHESIEA